MQVEIFISLGVYFLVMLLVGYYSYRRTSDLSDYMLGGRKVGPAVTALSAGASDMSGWMMMGLPGAMFVSGLSEAWLSIGLFVGAYVNYIVLAPRLRTYTIVANDSITIPDFLENRFEDHSKMIRTVSAIVILVFYTLYTSSGLVAGGTLFESSFGANYQTGLLITAGVVVAYTLFGGFLAVSMTDFIQGVIMFVALILVPIVAFTQVGGVGATMDEIRSIDPAMLNLFKGTTFIGILSLLAWGLGYFGQPHIIVRFMAVGSLKQLKSARRIGMGWMGVSLIGAMLTGLAGAAYHSMNGTTLENSETIFIYFADVLFHPYITGFLLAAVLAAIMSTISSQLLVTSSSLTEDFYKAFFKRNASDKELVFVGRLAVLIVAIVGVSLSLYPSDTILGLVGYAWAGFGSAFGPVLLLSLYWKRMTKWGALAGMIVGAVTVLIWANIDILADFMYEMIPGFFLSLLAVIFVSLLTKKPDDAIHHKFDEMEKVLHEES
ncbi:sodium/proline symporter PutP [Mesobacillus maritimus]|uniref:Sodium/proline symporter n=1 Tax=Mesobacillus maritimus TaxID=1643336 RepID=A0ABS7JZX0_9BACI|nr:sodium/proline symporter PutP [Mesobacillus maritimus]